MVTIVTACISAVSAIIVAWLGVWASQDKKDREKRQKAADERESRREQRDKFLLEYMDLSADYSLHLAVSFDILHLFCDAKH